MAASTAYFYDSNLAQTSSDVGTIMFEAARDRARRSRVWAMFTRRPKRLAPVDALTAGKTIVGRRDMGTQSVRICQIRGSKGRCEDFDGDFNPIGCHTCERWISIANAHRQGAHLPPVELIQIGDDYAVWDGHHRISVAKALKADTIEASVTMWELSSCYTGCALQSIEQ